MPTASVIRNASTKLDVIAHVLFGHASIHEHQIFDDLSNGTRIGMAIDDAVMLDTHGLVAETNATHLFLVHRGQLCTPRAVACPEGITRATVLELCAANQIP